MAAAAQHLSPSSSELPPPVSFALPWPPSVNTYWRSAVIGGRVRVYVSDKGKAYRKEAGWRIAGARARAGLAGRVALEIRAFPPDRRKRDLDNTLKAVLDVMTEVGVWNDDSQVDELTIRRGDVVKGGRLEIRVTPITPPEPTQESML